MTATDIAAYGGLIVSAFGLVGLPVYINYRKDRDRIDNVDGLNMRSMAAMLKDERDSLIKRLDDTTKSYESKITALKMEYEAKLSAVEERYQIQITGMRAEIDELYRRLYRPPPERQ